MNEIKLLGFGRVKTKAISGNEITFIIDREYFRKRFKKVILEFCGLFPPDYQQDGEEDKLLNDLMKCFDEEK